MRKRHAAILSEEGELKGSLGTSMRKWGGALDAFNEKYAQAKGRASTHETQLNQLAQMEKRVADLRSAIAKTRREMNGLGRPEVQYAEVRKTWNRAKSNRAKALQQECETMTARSGGEIRATVRIGAGVDVVLQKLRAAVTGSGLRKEKIDAIAEAIASAEDPDEQWTEILGDLERLAGYDPGESGEKNVPNCPALKTSGFLNADLVRIATKLGEDAWLDISLSRLEDRPTFEYRAREGEYIPFTNASAGQQATALLKALLNQPGPPLVIDQPEEDLDNPVMLQIVTQIWEAKKARQLILASHNANLVVNGDAELVVWCDYRSVGDQSGGQIRATGAIDVPVICDAIKQVMEGGEQAFRLRKEKYGF
jgi:type III restriction enzyme